MTSRVLPARLRADEGAALAAGTADSAAGAAGAEDDEDDDDAELLLLLPLTGAPLNQGMRRDVVFWYSA